MIYITYYYLLLIICYYLYYYYYYYTIDIFFLFYITRIIDSYLCSFMKNVYHVNTFDTYIKVTQYLKGLLTLIYIT